MLQPAKELSEFHTDYFMYVDVFKIINKFAKQEGNLLELKRERALDWSETNTQQMLPCCRPSSLPVSILHLHIQNLSNWNDKE